MAYGLKACSCHPLRSISYNMRRYSLNLHWNQNVLTCLKNKTQTVCGWCKNLFYQVWNFYAERLELLSSLIIDMGDETGWMGCNCNRIYVSVHPHLLIGNKSVVILRAWRGYFDWISIQTFYWYMRWQETTPWTISNNTRVVTRWSHNILWNIIF